MHARLAGFVLALAVTPMLLWSPATPAARAHTPSLAWMAQLAGACWRGALPGGMTDTQCYQLRLGHFLIGSIQLERPGKPTSEVVFNGEGMFIGTTDGSILVRTYGSDGSYSDASARVVDGQILFDQAPGEDGREQRNRWERLGADSYRVYREVRGDAGWESVFSVDYQRQPETD